MADDTYPRQPDQEAPEPREPMRAEPDSVERDVPDTAGVEPEPEPDGEARRRAWMGALRGVLLPALALFTAFVVGAFIIISMQSYLAELGSWVTIVQGFIFVVCVLAFRRGIVGELEAWLRRRRR